MLKNIEPFYWVFVALFTVSLILPLNANAGDEPTAEELLSSACPPISVSGKALYDADCVIRYFTSVQQTPQPVEESPQQELDPVDNDETKVLGAEIATLQERIQSLN